MKPMTSLLILLFFIISTAAYSQDEEFIEYDPEIEEAMMREDDQLPHFEAYGPGEIEQLDESFAEYEETDFNLPEESLPEEYYE